MPSPRSSKSDVSRCGCGLHQDHPSCPSRGMPKSKGGKRENSANLKSAEARTSVTVSGTGDEGAVCPKCRCGLHLHDQDIQMCPNREKNTARNEEQHKKADTSNSGAPYVRASGTDDDCKKFDFDGWNTCYKYSRIINMFQYGFLESCNRSSV